MALADHHAAGMLAQVPTSEVSLPKVSLSKAENIAGFAGRRFPAIGSDSQFYVQLLRHGSFN